VTALWRVRRERHGGHCLWVARNRLGQFYSAHRCHGAAMRSATAGARVLPARGLPVH
jgi:hypothetical protein